MGFNLGEVYTHADLTLYADIPGLYNMRAMPATHRFLGPLIWSPAIPLPQWWQQLPSDRPIVYVTLGSSGNNELLPTLLAALGRMEVTALATLAGCTTPPSDPPPHANPAMVAPAAAPESIPEGVVVSPPKRGNLNAAFSEGVSNERTFPNNLIGARLIFTSNLKMPKLEAVIIGADRFHLRVRFSNPGNKPLVVSLACTYAGDSTSSRQVKNLSFPVNTYRDMEIDFDGQPDRTIYIRASAVAAP